MTFTSGTWDAARNKKAFLTEAGESITDGLCRARDHPAKAHCGRSAMPILAEPKALVDGKEEENQTLYI
jgi:hypothetical protein